MKKSIFIIFCLISNVLFSQKIERHQNYVVINSSWFYEKVDFFNLTAEELKAVNLILNQIIINHNKSEIKQETITSENQRINLDSYKRQYHPYINKKGEKLIWINCFCGEWNVNNTKETIFVEDGGKCYFNLEINLTTGKSSEIEINGNA